MKKPFRFLLPIALALFSLWCTADLMRKNDQAVTLAGAHDMVRGQMQGPAAYYQFDKTYVTYAVCAAPLRIFRGADPVAVTNRAFALIFWVSLALFGIRFRRTLDPLTLLCFITAPAVFLNTVYVNSSVLSSGFLLLSILFLFQKNTFSEWIGALLFGLAAGSRADVLLLLPLILWLITPFGTVRQVLTGFPSGRNGLRSACAALSAQIKITGTGLIALIAGQALFQGGGAALDPFFNLKMAAGYTVFGFAAAGILFVFYTGCLAVQTIRAERASEKLYRAAGLAAFLLPVLFFLPQLHSPRYFWRGCEAVLLVAVFNPGLLRLPRRIRPVLLTAALLPLVFGVRLPDLTRPRVAVTQPTLFPSGDGFYPMGGYLPFMFRLRQASENPVDHNQMVWRAARETRLEPDTAGTVPVFSTPMSGYLLLSASLQGQRAERLLFSELEGRVFYADSRSLMRDDPKTPIGALDSVLRLPARFVSPVSGGVGILQFGKGDDRWGRQTRLLNRLFKGNEYRVFSCGEAQTGDEQSVVFSDQPFEGSRYDTKTDLYFIQGGSTVCGPGQYRADAVHPPWMRIQAFRTR